MKKFLFVAVALCFGLACSAQAQQNNQNKNTSIHVSGGNNVQSVQPQVKAGTGKTAVTVKPTYSTKNNAISNAVDKAVQNDNAQKAAAEREAIRKANEAKKAANGSN